VKRLSASVLLDHIIKTENGRRFAEAPPPERLRAIKDLVSAIVGFQQERGDQIIVEALPFETTRNLAPLSGPVAAPPTRPRLELPKFIPEWLRAPLEGHLNWLVEQNWLPPIIIVFLLGVLYGLFRILRGVGRKATGLIAGAASKVPFGKKKKGQHVDITMEPALEGSAEAARLEAGGAEGEGVAKSLDEQLRDREKLREKMTNEALLELEIPKAEVRRGEILTRHLSDLATKDPEGVANLIRTWTEGKGFY
jgi:flagellar M-ring protein FliF